MNDIVQLKITLKETKPPVRRPIPVDQSTTFQRPDRIIQSAMGWTNSHLHEFEINGYTIGLEEQGDGIGSDLDPSKEKPEKCTGDQKGSFSYTYDLGDSWRHIMKIEDFPPEDKDVRYPVCIAGVMNCPPEDCGWCGRFYDLPETVKDKRHPEHRETLEWAGWVI